MADTRFNCLPTVIGTMPQIDPVQACKSVSRFLKDIPAWPQLTNKSFLENMNVQCSEKFPGIVVEDKRIFVNGKDVSDTDMGKLYEDYLAGNFNNYEISREYASGLYEFISMDISPPFVKGQLAGPVTWGLSVTDENKKAILYDDTIGDAVPKFLNLKAKWQENILKQVSRNTVIFLDEPYMSSFGSAAMSVSSDKIISLINEVLEGLTGIKGIHCCGNTDWPVLLGTKTDIISFDAYNYAGTFSLYPDEIKGFLHRDGAIAWGIIPNTEEALNNESVASLKDRLDEAMAPFTRNGIQYGQMLSQALLTPSCGLEGLKPEVAEYALELLESLSLHISKKIR